MSPFVVGHATHPHWSGAFALVAAQIDAQIDAQASESGGGAAPTLGWAYFTDAYASAAEALLAALRERWPGVCFVGTVGIGVCASGVEYFDEPALVVMLAALPRDQFQVFSGTAGLRGARSPAQRAATALVHADPSTPDLSELLAELADRTETGYLFGGIAASRQRHVQIADGVFQGGLSGVAFGAAVSVISRVTQGCTPLGATRRVTACDGNVVLALDGRAALPQLLADLQLLGPGGAGPALHPRALRDAVPRLRRTLVGLTEPPAPNAPATVAPERGAAAARGGNFGEEVRVRHLIGIDPGRQGFAVAEGVRPGMGLRFCERDAAAARRDLVRMCTEVRDEIETRVEARRPPVRLAAGPGGVPSTPAAPGSGAAADPADPVGPGARAGAPAGAAGGATGEPRPQGMLGALYVSCTGRGGPHFGGASAELQIVKRALGDVPLVGFFAAGEIAHRQLYGYTGVLTVFSA